MGFNLSSAVLSLQTILSLPFLGHSLQTPLNMSSISPTETCFLRTAASLDEFVDCLDGYTVSADYYNSSTYATAQPSATEKEAFQQAILALLDLSVEDNCSPSKVPAALASSYTFSLLYDRYANSSFCILSEISSLQNGNDTIYSKGWGLFIAPIPTESVQFRSIHLSAPHPAYDLHTPQQAAALFRASAARSLLISGRSRLAFSEATDCIHPSNPETTYYKTDPAHDTNEPFFDASLTILEWQLSQQVGCPSASCAFIQWHGKGANTCSSDSAFLSSGLGTSNSSIAWYKDLVDRPVKRIRSAISKHFNSGFTASLPSDDTSCTLTATTNVVGRTINNVPRSDVCNVAATANITTGMFVHIEQSSASRNETVYGNWTEVIKEAFPLS